MTQFVVEKQVSNAILYTNGTIMLQNVRVSYPHLDKPFKGKDAKDGDDGKFTIVALMPKVSHVAAKNLCKEVIDKMIAEKKFGKLGSDKKFLRDGDQSSEVSYEGQYTVNASESRQPAVRNRKGELVLEPRKIADMIYGGCWANVLIRPWPQDNSYGKRINAGLIGVQFVRDDKPFGEGRIDDSDADWGSDDSDGDGMDDDDDDL